MPTWFWVFIVALMDFSMFTFMIRRERKYAKMRDQENHWLLFKAMLMLNSIEAKDPEIHEMVNAIKTHLNMRVES